jgi:predicted Zn-dependent peptidase
MGDRQFDALEVAAQILAGGKGSRLYRRLVRDEKIAQDVSFFVLGLVGGASIAAGQATVRPGVDPAVVERAFEEELERIGREPVTADELARARALIETYELEAPQRVDERADRLAMYATLLDDPEMINRQMGRYLGVTAADIQAAAAEVLRPENRVVLTYMPEKQAATGTSHEETAA